MDLTFRDAAATDDCRDLLYSSAPELYDYMFARGKIAARDYIAHEFQSGVGYIGHAIHTVAVANGEIVGVGAFYTRDDHTALQRGSAYGIFRFYGLLQVPSVLWHANHSGSVIRRPRPGSVYIANLGVRADMRGHGIGAALIEHETAKANAAGFERMTLDVADNNPRAEALYTRLGFRVIKEKQFKGRKNSGVPSARFMERPIQRER